MNAIAQAAYDPIVTDMDGLIRVLRARAVELGFSHETLDELSGLQRGYTGKVLGPARVKNLGGMSFGALLGALGLRLRVEVDPDAMRRVVSRGQVSDKSRRMLAMESRPPFSVGPLGEKIRLRALKIHAQLIAGLGAKARNAKLSPRRRSQIARRAAKARWSRR